MNNINKELNQYSTVPNPDDIPDTLGFIEAGNYIANYLVLLTNNILFKIGEKIDEYANGIEEYSFDNFRNYLEKKILIPSCKALSAIRNIMQDRFQVFSMLPLDNIAKNQYALEYFWPGIFTLFADTILLNSGHLSVYGSRIRYEVYKKEKEITKVLNKIRDIINNINNNQPDITSSYYLSEKDWLECITNVNLWYYGYNYKVANRLEKNTDCDITQLSNNYLKELHNDLILQFNQYISDSLSHENKTYGKEIRTKIFKLIKKLDEIDWQLPRYDNNGKLYDYNRELRETFNAHKDAIDNTYD